MYFATYNFYDDIVFDKEEQCLICLETSNNLNEINKMQLHTTFTTTCNCNCFFHNTCLFHWVNTRKSCPICHKNMQINIILHSNNNNKLFIQLLNGYIFISKLFFCIFISRFILISFYIYYEIQLQTTIQIDYCDNDNFSYSYSYSYL